MDTIIESQAKILAESFIPTLITLLSGSRDSLGDLGKAEAAVGAALSKVREQMVAASLEQAGKSVSGLWFCPICHQRLTAWSIRERQIMTRYGDGPLSIKRYRCQACGHSAYPLQTLNDLDKTSFTIGARELIAREAANGPFGQAKIRLAELGVQVSASEVERIADEAGGMRKAEEELLRIHLHTRNADLPLPLVDWDAWGAPNDEDYVLISVDGAKIRSDQMGDKGLEWFEVRGGIISCSRKGVPTVRTAGHMTPDQIFETLRALWRQCPWNGKTRVVFVADGAEWIWERVKLFFPEAVQVLDLYHASLHVACAARACWGDKDERALDWTKRAMPILLELGANHVIEELRRETNRRQVVDAKEFETNLAYLVAHSGRMQYEQTRKQGLPIGSGAMESSVKQLSTVRLRAPGMMWTRQGADLILRLRAAQLSGAMALTFNRHRKICANRIEKYKQAA